MHSKYRKHTSQQSSMHTPGGRLNNNNNSQIVQQQEGRLTLYSGFYSFRVFILASFFPNYLSITDSGLVRVCTTLESMHTSQSLSSYAYSSRVCILASRSTSHSSVRACTNTLVVVAHTCMHNKIRDITLQQEYYSLVNYFLFYYHV